MADKFRRKVEAIIVNGNKSLYAQQIERDRQAQIERDSADLAEERSRAQADALRLQYDLADTDKNRRDMAAMPYADVPALMKKLAAAQPTTGRDALRFTIYNAVRSNETRMAVWTEFALDSGIWTIPGERMKARETHVVPLSPPALALLRRLWRERVSDTGLVFTNNGTKPISDMTMTKLLRDDGIEGVTVHGFRSAFTDWSSEQTNFPKEVADKALAHKLPNKVEAAYRRTDFFEKRRELMTQWAEFLDQTPSSNEKPVQQVADLATSMRAVS